MLNDLFIEPEPPKFRNPKLEKLIENNKNGKILSLKGMKLTDQDMEIVAYYGIRNDQVI